jgi:Polyketide cyclase / dehydrase and lipid transport
VAEPSTPINPQERRNSSAGCKAVTIAALRICETVGTIRLLGSVCIDAPVEVVWARLARLEDIRLWSEAVLDARCEGARSQGVGAERTCHLRGGITIRERWLGWEEGRSFVYEGVGIPLVTRARNEWTVQREGDQTLLVSQAEVVLRGGPLARLLEPLVAYQLNRIGSRTLAAFKYLVERGEPPKVKHAKLPRVATAC